MVFRLQATIDEELAERVKRVKEENEWSWTEFMRKTAELYENIDYEEVLDE